MVAGGAVLALSRVRLGALTSAGRSLRLPDRDRRAEQVIRLPSGRCPAKPVPEKCLEAKVCFAALAIDHHDAGLKSGSSHGQPQTFGIRGLDGQPRPFSANVFEQDCFPSLGLIIQKQLHQMGTEPPLLILGGWRRVGLGFLHGLKASGDLSVSPIVPEYSTVLSQSHVRDRKRWIGASPAADNALLETASGGAQAMPGEFPPARWTDAPFRRSSLRELRESPA